MWKKDDVSDQSQEARPEERPRPERSKGGAGSAGQATIGRSITIKGEVSGDEDLLIQGTVDGSVDLANHSVTVGPEGEVKADLVGRVITVEGRVDGNLLADEQAILRSSAVVHGDIKAPRVVLEDGARFRGGVDMGDASRSGGGSPAASGARSGKESSFPKTETPASGSGAGASGKTEEQKEKTGAEAGA